jgi:hypothetical protein
VAGGIVGADVGLHFDDAPGGAPTYAAHVADKNLA